MPAVARTLRGVRSARTPVRVRQPMSVDATLYGGTVPVPYDVSRLAPGEG